MILDGKRPPKPEPMKPLTFRSLAVEPIAAPETIEVSMSLFDRLLEADDFATTIPMDLTEVGK